MQERTKRAFEILADAYNNGTLAAGHCACCAVGNLVAATTYPIELELLKVIISKRDLGISLQCARWTTTWTGNTVFFEVAQNTGYSERELYFIERAFEENTKIDVYDYHRYPKYRIKEDQFNGLKAVAEVLLELDTDPFDIEEVFLNKLEYAHN
jgi:hypothetical protein